MAAQNKYNGVCLAAPFYESGDKDIHKNIGMLEMISKVTPNKLFPQSKQEKKHMQNWMSNDLYIGNYLSPHTAIFTNKIVS